MSIDYRGVCWVVEVCVCVCVCVCGYRSIVGLRNVSVWL